MTIKFGLILQIQNYIAEVVALLDNLICSEEIIAVIVANLVIQTEKDDAVRINAAQQLLHSHHYLSEFKMFRIEVLNKLGFVSALTFQRLIQSQDLIMIVIWVPGRIQIVESEDLNTAIGLST